jgi:ABC-type transport system involved in multi-copper enzyme maturation permease subunit
MERWLGPVFVNEWLTTSRRWQVYAGRSVFVAALLVGLWSAWVSRASDQGVSTIQIMASVGQGFFSAIAFTQMTFTLMVAPASTAGAICQDRSSGKLEQLLTTELSDSEIILGKLAARLLPMLGLVTCALPALALSTLLGGVDPLALAGAFLITVGLAVLGCTLALTFSMWAAKPYEALLATYSAYGIWLIVLPTWDFLGRLWRIPTSPDWAIPFSPFYLAFAPYVLPGKVGVLSYAGFFAAMLAISAVLTAIAIKRMRAVIAGRAGRSAGANAPNVDPPGQRREPNGRRWLRTDRDLSLDDGPVFWYETRRTVYSPWIQVMLRIYLVLALVFSMLALFDIVQTYSTSSFTRLTSWLPAYVVAFQVTISLPVILLAAVTAVVEERAQGSLDVLLTTPLATRTIMLTKWWCAFRVLPIFLVLPAILMFASAWPTGAWALVSWLGIYVFTTAAMWTSIGLALSIWIKRLGRAIVLAAAIYALVCLAWPVLMASMFGANGTGPAMMSPFYACFYLVVGLYEKKEFDALFTWTLFWIAAQSVVALGLLIAELLSFDRCLGRARG